MLNKSLTFSLLILYSHLCIAPSPFLHTAQFSHNLWWVFLVVVGFFISSQGSGLGQLQMLRGNQRQSCLVEQQLLGAPALPDFPCARFRKLLHAFTQKLHQSCTMPVPEDYAAQVSALHKYHPFQGFLLYDRRKTLLERKGCMLWKCISSSRKEEEGDGSEREGQEKERK